METTDWNPVPRPHCIALSLAVALMLWLAFRTEDHWVPVLDSFNLVIHEAGHPLIGMLSGPLMVYGGTILQLAFPLIFAVHFYRECHTTGFAISVVWLGENLLNVGRYMADARAQLLPLVGGGEHDWTEIFSRWHVLHLDTRIGGLTRFLGTLIMIYGVLWLWRRWAAQED